MGGIRNRPDAIRWCRWVAIADDLGEVVGRWIHGKFEIGVDWTGSCRSSIAVLLLTVQDYPGSGMEVRPALTCVGSA